MARKLHRTARGELVDFDAIIIKQQLSEAPMNIEVERRKKLIDAKESRKQIQLIEDPVDEVITDQAEDFDIQSEPITKEHKKKDKKNIEPEINLPERT